MLSGLAYEPSGEHKSSSHCSSRWRGVLTPGASVRVTNEGVCVRFLLLLCGPSHPCRRQHQAPPLLTDTKYNAQPKKQKGAANPVYRKPCVYLANLFLYFEMLFCPPLPNPPPDAWGTGAGRMSGNDKSNRSALLNANPPTNDCERILQTTDLASVERACMNYARMRGQEIETRAFCSN